MLFACKHPPPHMICMHPPPQESDPLSRYSLASVSEDFGQASVASAPSKVSLSLSLTLSLSLSLFSLSLSLASVSEDTVQDCHVMCW
jgi:hypothetical protein